MPASRRLARRTGSSACCPRGLWLRTRLANVARMLPRPPVPPSLTILLAANPQDMAALMPALELAGFGVLGAAGLPVARALLREFRPNLLVASLHLGENNGFQLAMMTRQEHGPVPTFVVGEADLLADAQAERIGAQLLTDPLSATDLVALVMRALRSEAPRRWRRGRPHRPIVAQGSTGRFQAGGVGAVVGVGLCGGGLELVPGPAERRSRGLRGDVH